MYMYVCTCITCTYRWTCGCRYMCTCSKCRSRTHRFNRVACISTFLHVDLPTHLYNVHAQINERSTCTACTRTYMYTHACTCSTCTSTDSSLRVHLNITCTAVSEKSTCSACTRKCMYIVCTYIYIYSFICTCTRTCTCRLHGDRQWREQY